LHPEEKLGGISLSSPFTSPQGLKKSSNKDAIDARDEVGDSRRKLGSKLEFGD
jgi:hypothetical protein